VQVQFYCGCNDLWSVEFFNRPPADERRDNEVLRHTFFVPFDDGLYSIPIANSMERNFKDVAHHIHRNNDIAVIKVKSKFPKLKRHSKIVLDNSRYPKMPKSLQYEINTKVIYCCDYDKCKGKGFGPHFFSEQFTMHPWHFSNENDLEYDQRLEGKMEEGTDENENEIKNEVENENWEEVENQEEEEDQDEEEDLDEEENEKTSESTEADDMNVNMRNGEDGTNDYKNENKNNNKNENIDENENENENNNNSEESSDVLVEDSE